MITVSISRVEAGWAFAPLNDGINEMMLMVGYTPTDAIRDFVDAVQSLSTIDQAECCWFQQPGELHWSLRRVAMDVILDIHSFAVVTCPGRHSRSGGTSMFHGQTNYLGFARHLENSLTALRTTLGLEGYRQAWRHAFPMEAHEKLARAIQAEDSRSGVRA